MVVLQSIASVGFVMELGDVSGAFLEADQMEKELYAAQPTEGLPGLNAGQLVMLLTSVYGIHSAPNRWYCTWDGEIVKCGWEKVKSNQCVYVV